MSRLRSPIAFLAFLGLLSLLQPVRAQELSDPAPAAKPDDAASAETLYELKYKFQPGETLRWKVEHRAKIRTTVSGTTQTAETESFSVKVWKVAGVDAKTGNVDFMHSVESVRMVQRLTGRKEETYDSTTDKVVPAAFQETAKSVGVPLSRILLNSAGAVVERKDRTPQAKSDSQITVPLPKEPVAAGHEWSVPNEIELGMPGGQVKKIQCRQQYKLESVKNGIATITIATVILTPVRDPAIEAQLIQRESSGTVRFDIEAGRIVSQLMDLDKQVLGFSGEASSMHYQTRFTEALMPAGSTAAKSGPVAGPKPKLQR